MKKFVCCLVLFGYLAALSAQNRLSNSLSGAVPGSFLIQLQPPFTSSKQLLETSVLATLPVVWENLSPELGIFNLQSMAFIGRETVLLGALQSSPVVKAVQQNHWVQRRNTLPNDPLFPNQWHHTKIKTPQVWAETTGGRTPCGDTVVVAVLDFGFDINHPDLRANIWQNRAEIANNNLDDDNNGYIDDTNGLNARDNTGQHLVDSLNNGVLDPHGTLCAGLIGAVGDNQRGVAGVLWSTKLLVVSGTFSEAEVVKGYMYVHDLRKKYNLSGGRNGAFIAVTSASVGLSGGSVAQNRLWCDVYDLLGQQGILNVVAAANQNNTVERIGDIPALCPSPYLVVVTRTDNTDKLSETAAYSPVNVDLAAPGVDVLTTTPGQAYGEESGNSFAAPLVAGAAALLYTLPSLDSLCRLTSVADKTLAIKQALLSGTDPLSTLANKTVSGGRLNVFGAAQHLKRQWGMPIGRPKIVSAAPNPAQANIFLSIEWPLEEKISLLMVNTLGQIVWTAEQAFTDLNQPFWPINVENMPNGLYFITLKSQTFEAVVKVVVQH